MMSVINQCPFCGEATEILVYPDDYFKWEMGELAQNCFPYLTATEREVLISGICPNCQTALFEEEEEEEDYYEDDDLELGFDPYLGEYTWDC